MGLFDKFKGSSDFEPKNEQEAWTSILYACAAVDGEISDAEIDSFSRLLLFKQKFKNYNFGDLFQRLSKANKEIGGKQIIEKSAKKVTDEYKQTVFALAMETVLSDGLLGDKEAELVEILSKSLALTETDSQKIVDVILIKMKGNLVF